MSDEIVTPICGIEFEGAQGDPFPQSARDHEVGRPPIGDPEEDPDEERDEDEEGESDDDDDDEVRR